MTAEGFNISSLSSDNKSMVPRKNGTTSALATYMQSTYLDPSYVLLGIHCLTPMSWPGSEKHILENICCVGLFLPKHLKIPKRTASFQDPFILSGNL